MTHSYFPGIETGKEIDVLRIIAGKHRGRLLQRPPESITRPTTDRVREAMFNILTHGGLAEESNTVTDAVVLEAFGGSGALALEALSRGARYAYVMEKDKRALRIIQTNIKTLKEELHSCVYQGDTQKPPVALEPASLIFLDPPYGKGLVEKALAALLNTGWIAPNAILVAEIHVDETVQPPASIRTLQERVYGNVRLVFMAKEG
jgi:16S rRNA (guanine966-N2)-methyltransferase